jgi:hypothetical protein
MTTSDYFSGFLPILNSRRAQLLDHKRLAAQLCSLERRPSRIGAKDSISHPFGGHDDCAAAVAGLMVRLVGTRDYQLKSFHVPFTGPSRSSVIGAFEASFVAADVTMPPGGWPAGSPQVIGCGLSGNLTWTHTRMN